MQASSHQPQKRITHRQLLPRAFRRIKQPASTQKALLPFKNVSFFVPSSLWRRPLLWTMIFVLLSLHIAGVQSALECGTNTTFCEEQLRPGSVCGPNGHCTNPFASGCLRAILGEEKALQYTAQPKRACNSDDDDDGGETNNTLCSTWEFEYPEIRIAYGNWESSMFISWIFQILLSELLGVPVTIETTPNDPTSYRKGRGSFYDLDNDFSYAGQTYTWEAFHRAMDLHKGDCRLSKVTTTSNDDDSTTTSEEDSSRRRTTSSSLEYTPCAHLIAEIWPGQRNVWDEMEGSGAILPVSSIDVVGRLGIFIPKFTAEEDLSFTSYLGLSLPENRQKVAEAFKSPTTWTDYCRFVSETNCSIPDQVALRPPLPHEDGRYFAPRGLYRGHFRSTPQNDCQRFPDNCTGFFIDGPCDWSTWSQAQLHWNKIPLESDGPNDHHGSYSYSSMVDIWYAANETKSNVMMWWWSTDYMMQDFAGTSAEFIKVNFPIPSLKCIQSRVPDVGRCSANPAHRRGIEEGACDYEPSVLRKALSSTLITSQEDVPEPHKSAAMDLIEDFSLSDVVVDYLMKEWGSRNVDRYGFDGREAVCKWIASNVEDLRKIIPMGYPRKIEVDQDQYKTLPYIMARLIAILALLCSLISAIVTIHWRERKVIRYAQPDFLYIILMGFVLLSIASLLFTIEPETVMCVVRQWLVSLGYSLELLPLIVKVHAILNAIRRARVFRRVKMPRSSLYGVLALFLAAVILYMLVWTLVDPPQRKHQLLLTGDYDENGRELLDKRINCISVNHAWPLVLLGWQFLLLFCASVLAVETRNIRSDFNESQLLGFMIYTHFMFVLLRLLVEIFMAESLPTYSNILNSLFLSIDTLIALGIYFIPKFYTVMFVDGDISPSFVKTHTSHHQASHSNILRQSWISAFSMAESHGMLDEFETGRSLRQTYDNRLAEDLEEVDVDGHVTHGVVPTDVDHDNLDLSNSGRSDEGSQFLLGTKEDEEDIIVEQIESTKESSSTNESGDPVTSNEILLRKDHNSKENDRMEKEQSQESATVSKNTAVSTKSRLSSSLTSSTSGAPIPSALAGSRKRSNSASQRRVSFSNMEIDVDSMLYEDDDENDSS